MQVELGLDELMDDFDMHQSINQSKKRFHEATNEAAISSVSISPDGRGEGRVALKIAKYVFLRWPQQMSMLLGPAIRDSYKSNMPCGQFSTRCPASSDGIASIWNTTIGCRVKV